jgi:hypothetical protein
MEPRGIPGDKDFVASLSQAMGFLAVNFGLFEFALNAVIATIHHWVAQPVKGRGELPYMLKERLRYVRESAVRYSVLDSHKDELREIAAEAKRLSKTRNGVFHGYPADYDAPTRMLTFISTAPGKPDKRMHKESRFAITIEALLSDGLAAEVLCEKTGLLSHRLMQELAP